MACALAGLPLRVALIEAVPFQSPQQPSYDERCIALAYGSRRIFEGLGLWPLLAGQVTPISSIHVSDRGHFGFARLAAQHYHYPAFGYVVENSVLGQMFGPRLAQQTNLTLCCPARLQSLRCESGRATALIEQQGQQRTMTARLVIGADGGRSQVREQAGIAATVADYQQSAIIANLSISQPHRGQAFERFTDSGPLALLPLDGQRCSLVWTVARDAVAEVMALDDGAFLQRLEQRFGRRLGRFIRIGRRHAYPLQLVSAAPHQVPRLALIGNAAHTLHPIAGQGFNLGIRDVAVLAQTICDALQAGNDPGGSAVLAGYEQWRQRDQRSIIRLTDGLVRLFSNDLAPLVLARSSALLALDLIPGLKRHFARQTMGLAGRLPRLARGLPLAAGS
ncbi:MAG: 2-octaprenyl-6-methoxyphenyl hydroxylase [Gammaproteobacteria bacterium]|nr:2-octaprenyl-6-methoxyphenyl hydroxylase [Gammaproteobacteria bacterium]